MNSKESSSIVLQVIIYKPAEVQEKKFSMLQSDDNFYSLVIFEIFSIVVLIIELEQDEMLG